MAVAFILSALLMGSISGYMAEWYGCPPFDVDAKPMGALPTWSPPARVLRCGAPHRTVPQWVRACWRLAISLFRLTIKSFGLNG